MSADGKKARVAIADDHRLTRAGLRKLLAGEPSVEVVGEASDGREAVELCRRLRPDLVLMDVRMPRMDGLAATREIKRCQPGIGILMVTTCADPEYLLKALEAGAAGYVLKETGTGELISAVLRVLSGVSALDPDLSAKLLKRLGTRDGASPEPHPSVEPLTPRELEVLGLLARGRTNREIARILAISPGAVRKHVEYIIAKLGVPAPKASVQ